jgi:hypothetical protein
MKNCQIVNLNNQIYQIRKIEILYKGEKQSDDLGQHLLSKI